MRWSVALMVGYALLLISCSGGEYTIVVRFETEALADQVDRVEVYLVDDCGSLTTSGSAPVGPRGTLDLRRGATTTTFSAVVPGSYGLYARGFDGGTCQVVAAGCEVVTLVAGGEGELAVTLGPINGPLCPAGMPCTDGVCGIADAQMMDGAVDAPTDSGVPCSCVACASCDDAGACIADNAACGAGMYCDLVSGCTTGDPCASDADCADDGNPCTAVSCDPSLGICVPAALMDGTACMDGIGRDGQCRASACCTGCWDGGACVPGDDVSACGEVGDRCSSCDDGNACTTDSCVGGACSTTPAPGSCPGGTCVGGMCCTGCIESGACEMGDVVAACGSAGASCTRCDTSACPPERCTGGACMPLGATSVDTRRRQVLAVAPNGTLWAWGENNVGQLGLGDTTSRDVPTQVGTDADWAQVSGGQAHACGVKTGGQLFCWGSGGSTGRLGLGAVDSSLVPARVGTDSNWSMVTCGTGQTCAIKTDGTLWCWGDDSNGRVGAGAGGDVTTPTRIGSESDWTMVDSRSEHTCGIRGAGLLFCWGENGAGQLGIGTSVDASAPTRAGTDTDWATVIAGGSNGSGGGWACGLKTDGSRWCWGVNGILRRYGTSATTASVSSPRQIDDGPWRAMALGSTHGCAIAMDRSLHCWGDNSDQATGQATAVTSEPTRVGTESDYTSIACGSTATCAARATGAVSCFGDNGVGQLGRPGGASTAPVRACL